MMISPLCLRRMMSHIDAGGDHNMEDTPESAGHVPAGSLRPGAFVQAVAAKVYRHFERLAGSPDHIANHAPYGASSQAPHAQPAVWWPLHMHIRQRLAKFWFGPDGTVHYELWLHERTARLELGLHFESGPQRNLALYHEFDKCLLEIQMRLGNSIWLEEWDRGWTRLYETLPMWPLDESRAESIAARLCEIIEVLQPIYVAISERLEHATRPG